MGENARFKNRQARVETRVLKSGTAKGGRPWRGSVKIEPGFFQVSFENPEKNPVKNPEKNLVKTRKKPVGKCGEYAESWGSGDVVTDRGRTTHVPARGKTRKKPGSIFHRPLLTDPFWPEPIKTLACRKNVGGFSAHW